MPMADGNNAVEAAVRILQRGRGGTSATISIR
jgi:hypothetical protein